MVLSESQQGIGNFIPLPYFHQPSYYRIMQKIGILGAMPEEIEGIIQLMTECTAHPLGGRTYYSGKISGIEVTVVFSRWGKVAAATTVTTLIQEFRITGLVFTGVAGAIAPGLKIGDIVLAERLIQHDMDARPLMPRYEIPLLGVTWFAADPSYIEKGSGAINHLLANKRLHELISDDRLEAFNITAPSLFKGDIASGDQFFSGSAQKKQLQDSLPGILCVEMEGAAVAQVCFEYHIPFVVIRTISDTATENAAVDFPVFIKHIASKYSVEIIDQLFRLF
jgi:adenosylhomocysteine nucleosidase